jgi:hypothetical protein
MKNIVKLFEILEILKMFKVQLENKIFMVSGPRIIDSELKRRKNHLRRGY